MELSRRSLLKLGAASSPVVSVLSNMLSGVSAHAESASALASTGGIAKAFVCFRIGSTTWMNEARFTELLDLFDSNRGVTDEITLFTQETHPPLPLDAILARMPAMKARMEAARARGYRSGINILSTLGHHEENLPNSLSGDYTPMTDPNGNVCRGSFCPNGEALRGFIVKVYEGLVGANPDYIWLDDDIRLYGHMPIGPCCFCDTCVTIFSERAGKSFTRETLVAALSAGPAPEQMALRRAYLQHNRETIGRLFKLIEETVHAMAPEMPLGFMTGDRFFEGYDFDTWADILAGPNHAPVYWRPGGGTYTDERMASITDKAHDVGRQTAMLPPYVKCIESELESFPYQRLKKAAHSTALEAAAYIAGGCTGTAFNVMSQYDEPLDEFHPLVAHVRSVRPFLDVLARELGRAPSVGIHSGWCKDTYAAQNPGGPWFGGPGAPGQCNELWSTGLPASYLASQSSVEAWSGDQMVALKDHEIRAALRKGLYLDGAALGRLNEMGYGRLTGFETAEIRHDDCIEELTEHPLNGGFVGRRRNGRQSFWKCPTHFFKATNERAQAVSRCVDYTYTEIAPCCMGVFENVEGGRICVAGYYPYEQLQNLSKASQLKSIMRWLSKDTLPAYVASFHRVNLWVRQPAPDRTAIAIVNGYMDPAENLELLVRTDRTAMRVTRMYGGETGIESPSADCPYRRFVLPKLQPWEVALAVV